jgi:hypothetical protein
MNDTLCNARPTDPLPPAIWVPQGSYRIYRGTPPEIVREMAIGETEASLTVREALQQLTQGLATARKVVIQLPWAQSDEVLSALFLHALLDLGIGRPVPSA